MTWVVAALELHRLVGDRDLDPELLRLAERAAHQRHARNAGREAEVILDPRRGARLAAERAAIDREHGEPFRRRINRGGQPSRACTDDHHVVQLGGVERPDQADTACELAFGRIAQQIAVWTKHDRQFFGLHIEALDQGLRAAIIGRIELLIGMPVATKEIGEAKDVAILLAADDDRTCAGLDQADAPQDQRAHQPFSEVGFGNQ